MNRVIAALAALLTMTVAAANATDTDIVPAKRHYVSPVVTNVAVATVPSSRAKNTSTDVRCKELAADINAVTQTPDRGQKVVRGIGPDGKPRNELRAYDRRATLEAEYRQRDCWP